MDVSQQLTSQIGQLLIEKQERMVRLSSAYVGKAI
jgi:hypothetical protein